MCLTVSETNVDAATDYSATGNHGFTIGSSTNNPAYWYRKKSEKHYTDCYLAYEAFVYLGYSTHKGTVNVSSTPMYHDDIMVRVEFVPKTFTTNSQLGVKLKYQGYPEYYSVQHSLQREIIEYSPKNDIVPSKKYSVSVNASTNKTVGISGTVSGIEKKALEVSVAKSEKTATFKYNYVASNASIFTDYNAIDYCSGVTEQMNIITVRRSNNKKYNDKITTYGTAGYRYGIYVWQTGKSGGGEYTFAINRQ